KNTAAAAALAALAALESGKDTHLLLSPADHVVRDAASLRETVLRGLPASSDGAIVTIGIRPTAPETGYGYLEMAAEIGDGVHALARFVEKPDVETATRMLGDGKYLWNAGLFLARAATLIEAFEAHAPDILEAVRAAFAGQTQDLGFCRPDAAAWEGVRADSVDYAIMEKATKLATVPYAGHWSDLGAWNAIHTEGDADAHGNVTAGAATSIGCSGSLLRSEQEGIELVGIGLTDVVAVAMNDAVLVAHRDATQDVKKAVETLKAKGAKQATQLPIDHRPWGWFETLVLGPRFQVKRIHVHPGAALSLQSHHHRSEHWIVVEGTAKVTVDDEVKLISENESVYIPLGAVHRMENPGKVPMVLIEVQTGTYLGEDDIVRYEDVYARG
ncbi:MAG: mannose-1-phosphate guanylyltransferase/mannose-6-phosphate isomerase, partial [Pseudomonadota bacterium]